MNTKFKLFKSFNIPETFKAQIDKKNKFILKVLFWIAIVFGLSLLIVTLFRHSENKNSAIIYYASYLILGIVGHLLIKLNVPVPFLQGLILAYI